MASAAALRGRPALTEGTAAAATFPLDHGPPLPAGVDVLSGYNGDPALATVPLILRRDAYIDSLTAPGHTIAPLEAAWLGAAARALETPVTLEQPYAETGHFDATPDAASYRIALHAGERLRIELNVSPADAPVFLDLTAADDGATRLAARTGGGVIEHVAARDGEVLLRAQPPAGVAAAFTLTVTSRPALRFPVAGRGADAIISHFFEPRDGGARRHQGLDIRAPTGTPVIAAADGVIERVDENELGGRVVWLRETGADRVHYYAHLDRQLVRAGATVRAGDVVGTVGTTGNAPATTPHLHFEVRVGGENHDPTPFIDVSGRTEGAAAAAAATRAARPTGAADAALVRTSARTRLAGAALRSSLNATARAATLPRHTRVEILAVSGRHYRVRTADGVTGFLAAWLLEPVPAPATDAK